MILSKIAVAVSLGLCANDNDSYVYEPFWLQNGEYFIYPLADVYEFHNRTKKPLLDFE